jgi:hypothetical protein
MRKFLSLVAACTALALLPTAAAAYIGPGLGVGAITAVLGMLAAVLMAFAALLWYPVKRLLRGRRAAPTSGEGK